MDYTRFRQWCPPTRLGSLIHPGILFKAAMPGLQPVSVPLGQTPRGPDPMSTTGGAWAGTSPPTGASPEHQMAFHHMMKEYHHTSPDGNSAHAATHGAMVQGLAKQGVQTSAQHMREIMPHLPETAQRHFQSGLHMSLAGGEKIASLKIMDELISKAKKKADIGVRDPKTGERHVYGSPEAKRILEEYKPGSSPPRSEQKKEEVAPSPKKKAGRPRKPKQKPWEETGWGVVARAQGRDIPKGAKEEPKKTEESPKKAEEAPKEAEEAPKEKPATVAATETLEAAKPEGKKGKKPRVTKRMKQEGKRKAQEAKVAGKKEEPKPKTTTAEATETVKQTPKADPGKPEEARTVEAKPFVPQIKVGGKWVDDPKHKPKEPKAPKTGEQIGERKLTASEMAKFSPPSSKTKEEGVPRAELPKRGAKAKAKESAEATEQSSAKRSKVTGKPPGRMSEEEHVAAATEQLHAHAKRHDTGDDSHVEKVWDKHDKLSDSGRMQLEPKHFKNAASKFGLSEDEARHLTRGETGKSEGKAAASKVLSAGGAPSSKKTEELKPITAPPTRSQRKGRKPKTTTAEATETVKQTPKAKGRKKAAPKPESDVRAPKEKKLGKRKLAQFAGAKARSGAAEPTLKEFTAGQERARKEYRARGMEKRAEAAEPKRTAAGRGYSRGTVEDISPVAARMERERHRSRMQKEAQAKLSEMPKLKRETAPRRETVPKQQQKVWTPRGTQMRAVDEMPAAGQAAKEKIHTVHTSDPTTGQQHPHPSTPATPGPKLQEHAAPAAHTMEPFQIAPQHAEQPAVAHAGVFPSLGVGAQHPAPTPSSPSVSPSFTPMQRTATLTGGPQLSPGSLQRSLVVLAEMEKARKLVGGTKQQAAQMGAVPAKIKKPGLFSRLGGKQQPRNISPETQMAGRAARAPAMQAPSGRLGPAHAEVGTAVTTAQSGTGPVVEHVRPATVGAGGASLPRQATPSSESQRMGVQLEGAAAPVKREGAQTGVSITRQLSPGSSAAQARFGGSASATPAPTAEASKPTAPVESTAGAQKVWTPRGTQMSGGSGPAPRPSAPPMTGGAGVGGRTAASTGGPQLTSMSRSVTAAEVLKAGFKMTGTGGPSYSKPKVPKPPSPKMSAPAAPKAPTPSAPKAADLSGAAGASSKPTAPKAEAPKPPKTETPAPEAPATLPKTGQQTMTGGPQLAAGAPKAEAPAAPKLEAPKAGGKEEQKKQPVSSAFGSLMGTAAAMGQEAGGTPRGGTALAQQAPGQIAFRVDPMSITPQKTGSGEQVSPSRKIGLGTRATVGQKKTPGAGGSQSSMKSLPLYIHPLVRMPSALRAG